MSRRDYVIKGRFITGLPGRSEATGDGDAAYLGPGMKWCSMERARRFASPTAGETVLQETWSRLYNAGERSVILTIVRMPGGGRDG